MTESNDIKKLEMRITELEKAIREMASGQKAMNISKEEMQTFLKVKGALEPDFCGPNDCMVVRCLRCIFICNRCLCIRCINECVCGPCACRIGSGNIGGFEDLGE